ncbi:hypothetical protein GUA87_03815 [Sneathiella sp. P13V-1]|uniref:WYL domain-containing protein n=1 Tax=Sneathiella sp. P13V-1 TaxID=2697366 RepID=UPI00187B9008|nr:hypothetical protein [Sneathiella sp. P13V-1]MBE7635957.1 hypothetical protein [Sneathiella sp. P13V-1]
MYFDDLKHAQRERLIFLDRCFTWRGMANRRNLIYRFGISEAQAALDFRTYLDLVTTAPTYDNVRKSYIAADNHIPLSPSTLTEAFEVVVGEDGYNDMAVLPRPERKADPSTVAKLYQAMKARNSLHIRYTSMSSGHDEGQWVAPVRFTSDGESVYFRAFSFKHGEYRNYLPIRISLDSSFDQMELLGELPQDIDWNTKAIIWLRPRSDLSDEQVQVVRREYGFDGEFLRIETRKALEFFFSRRWGLAEEGARLKIIKIEYESMEV